VFRVRWPRRYRHWSRRSASSDFFSIWKRLTSHATASSRLRPHADPPHDDVVRSNTDSVLWPVSCMVRVRRALAPQGSAPAVGRRSCGTLPGHPASRHAARTPDECLDGPSVSVKRPRGDRAVVLRDAARSGCCPSRRARSSAVIGNTRPSRSSFVPASSRNFVPGESNASPCSGSTSLAMRQRSGTPT